MTHILDALSIVEWLQANASLQAHLVLDSRRVNERDVFVAVPGKHGDGRQYMRQAVERGASAIVAEAADEAVHAAQFEALKVPVLRVAGLKRLLGELASEWYGNPSQHLCVIAITGTNGKTSCAQWVSQLLSAQGVLCGTAGTLGVSLPGHRLLGLDDLETLTTPDALSLHRMMAVLMQAGAQAVALEASSIGIEEGRLDGTAIQIAAFTNLTLDHLDYHHTMEAYEAAKTKLFFWPGVSQAIINTDNEAGRRLYQSVRDKAAGVIGLCAYGTQLETMPDGGARVRAEAVRVDDQGIAFDLLVNQQRATVRSPLLGLHNIENLLLVAGVLHALDWPIEKIAGALQNAQAAPGRLQLVPAVSEAAPLVVIDYAHTPDALTRALSALEPIAQARQGELVCVFGCGGNRDATKRPLMAQAAAKADRVVLTSDNPRNEDPLAILQQVRAGWPAARDNPFALRVEPDRARAIKAAIHASRVNDVILISGKGHENYQEIGQVKHAFSDMEQATLALITYTAPATRVTLLDLCVDLAAVPHHMSAETARLPFIGVSTDNRKVQPGQVFFALKGERFDGHDFVATAAQAGAVVAVVEYPVVDCPIAQWVVTDTREALLQLATVWRQRFGLPLIAVTGSNGKTTTKEMIAAILASHVGVHARLATQGNLNNDIGLPLTLLGLAAHHRCAVVELGMNHPGEIAQLAAVAQPTVALVNNAQREHQEFMHTVEAVARENGDVLSALGPEGVAVFPADEPYTDIWTTLAGSRPMLRFGLNAAADVRAESIELDAAQTRFVLITPTGSKPVRLRAAGLHNVRNALAAAACALAIEVPLDTIVRGLEQFEPVKGRMQHHALGDGVLIDDSYNANPDSVRAAIDVLASLPGPRILVLGDMGEVGDQGPAVHAEVGRYAAERGIDALMTFGEAAQQTFAAFAGNGLHAVLIDEIAPAVRDRQPKAVLVKGSRFMRMERVVNALLNPPGPNTPDSTGKTNAA
ncbi:MAG: bifunctional UDP-N-acetylmuramoyl-L-alanyl-D-glutamate--2,6-diaminopimelate ligase MurE/UDP-N-acetylmuramoyl-tripeptide--D-alanyl-D-alanine ligase MurF [Pigmentiphaga sp.]|nr:bifunctional UDP-N-acetylmuramoyl-L-alanyl-D-glutamate--2,6-diaminopimelate ligase MurE/UDP-N-acetylmuramoyl-tripeptide--D-alanyl-D-alanine ligase MurF [Pigmentiphaga sp.]